MGGTGADAKGADGPIRVLLVEDDDRLADLTARYLELHGLSVTRVGDGGSGLAEATGNDYDLVLLDLMLPVRGGLEVCREIRAQRDVPIIMVTALGEEADRVLGLEIGADDYVSKPFSSPELLARIRAVVRRARGRVGPARHTFEVGGLRVDPGGMCATLDGRPLELTAYEFAILRALAERAGRVLSREQLLDLAKGNQEESFDRSIDVHIHRLRRKLGEDPRRPRLLKTVRGAGYMLASDGES